MLVRGRISWSLKSTVRSLYTATQGRMEDEGDWFYSSEWWGTDSDNDPHTIFRSTSAQGNGVVSVLAYPSSRPHPVYWSGMENWLQQRYEDMNPGHDNVRFRILGYQWRVLRFNDNTRQSTVKIMAGYRESEPQSIFLMQQANCLAVPYLKSMVSVGLATIASCNYDLMGVIHGNRTVNILCIGHGGGSLPLVLASKIPGATIDIIEIDPLVISASVKAMGFPSFSLVSPSGERVISKPEPINEVLWRGIHERLSLFEADAEKFILANKSRVYDMVFIDAYDGDDIFPRKLWDPTSPFIGALNECLHPEHGTVVVNLHSDSDVLDPDGSVPSVLQQVLPMGKYVSSVCRAYTDIVSSGSSGSGFVVAVPWVCNSTLVACKGFGRGRGRLGSREMVMERLATKSAEVEHLLNLPFSCLQYIKRNFMFVD